MKLRHEQLLAAKKVAENEFETVRTDLKTILPSEALLRHYHRLDTKIAEARDVSTTKTACDSGCWYCCYYKVVARAAEIFLIIDFVRRNFSGEQLTQVTAQAKKNVLEVEGFSHAEHLATNQRCPFLVDAQCSVYSVRPAKCRTFHATDVEGCRLSYERPTDLDLPNSYIPEVLIATEGCTQGFNEAMRFAGYDFRVYDLNSALIEALENPKCAKRFRDKKKAFLLAKQDAI